MPYVPIVADYDNDGIKDIFVVHAGSWGISAFPYNNADAVDPSKHVTSNTLEAAPLIDDLFNDSRLYMVIGGANSAGDRAAVYIWQLRNTSGGTRPWPMARNNPQRTGIHPRQAALKVSSSSLYLLQQSGTSGSERATLYVSNSGDGSFSWSIASQPAGITISPASGGSDQTLTVTFDGAGLSNGTHPGQYCHQRQCARANRTECSSVDSGNGMDRAGATCLPSPHSQLRGSPLIVNVLFLSPAFPPFPGGGERYARSLALQMLQRECAITVVASTARWEQDFWQASSATRQWSHATRRFARGALSAAPLARRTRRPVTRRKAMVLISACWAINQCY
jgi:hypothetical protein